MIWHLAHRCYPPARRIADRHYNRQSPKSPNFVPPGRCLVLVVPGEAVWVTSWPFAEYVRHRWGGAWICSAFRREGGGIQASQMIRQALAATRWRFGEPPAQGMVTFVNADKVRHKRDPGRCFLRAGFTRVGTTEGGLLAFQLAPEQMPPAEAPLGASLALPFSP